MIDYERLKLLVLGSIDDELVDGFDIDTIIKNATIKEGVIEVKSSKFVFWYDAVTYEQLGGAGGIK